MEIGSALIELLSKGAENPAAAEHTLQAFHQCLSAPEVGTDLMCNRGVLSIYRQRVRAKIGGKRRAQCVLERKRKRHLEGAGKRSKANEQLA